jgi:NAD(P)-dependent dehydrogenase (short-subunit alcohol dehydrogenase family)
MVDERVVLITGSSRGFGQLASQTLARKGYTVFATMRDPAGRNAAARDYLLGLAQQHRWPLHIIDLDVSNDGSVDRAVNEVIGAASHIDVLVNNAAFSIGGITEALSLEQAYRIFETNFFGTARMNRAVLPHMRRRRKGLIIHVSSTAGRSVFPGMGMYSASKFALEALAETYRYELSPLGIDSVILEPGPHATDVFSNDEAPSDQSRLEDYGKLPERLSEVYKTMRKHFGNPQDVADAILRLIETPSGERPLRHIVGPAVDRLRDLNEVSDLIEREIFEFFGIGNLLRIPRSTDSQTSKNLRFGWGGQVKLS